MSVPSFSPEDLSKWIPVRLLKGDPVSIQWMFRGGKKATEPFFDETISALSSFSENMFGGRPVTGPEQFLELSETANALPVKAIIFHVSRCGSTLLSQLLSLDPRHISFSEVPFFDTILRSGFSFPHMDEPLRQQWLQAAIRLYSNRRFTEEESVFIKTDCWHIFFYKSLRKLFPAVPFILLYRRPDEVLASQQKRRGLQAVPGLIEPSLYGFTPEDAEVTDLDAYFCRVEEKMLEAFVEVATADPLAVLMNYQEGMDIVFRKTVQVAGCTVPDTLEETVAARTGFHAKYPGQKFEPEQIPVMLRDKMQAAFVQYEKLEVLRKKSIAG